MMFMENSFIRDNWLQRIAWGTAVVTICILIISIVILFFVSNNANIILQANQVSSLVALVAPILGLLIVMRQPRNRVGWLIIVYGLLIGIRVWGHTIYYYHGSQSTDYSALEYIFLWLTEPANLATLPCLALLMLWFPNGQLPSHHWRLLYVWLFLAFAVLFSSLFLPGPNWNGGAEAKGIIIDNPYGWLPENAITSYLGFPSFISLLLIIILAAISLIVRYRSAGELVRLQLRWFVVGGFFTVIFFLLPIHTIATPVPHYEIFDYLSVLLGQAYMFPLYLAVGIAILRYRLYDIDLIVNRTLVYGGLSLLVIAIYVIVVGYLSFLFQTEANWGISLVATGIVALLFGRLRNWLQRGVNRLMYGQRDEPYQLLTHLGQQLETALDPTSAMCLAVETVAQALKLPYVAIRLQRGEEMQETAVYGTAQNEITPFPLVYAGQPIGELLVTARAPNEPLTTADQRLLTDLARQIGVTAHTHLLNTNLEQARLRLVTERGEARRQLGSDLHDGVGHQLVGLTRQLERARNITPDDPALAQQQLSEINQQLVALTKHVRHLAHQLYPPELELLGLVGAIEERAQTTASFQVRLDIERNLPNLPAEVETAVYYITLEALTNIEKHAQAQTCTIRLRLTKTSQPSRLQLEILDDGIGLPTNLNGGLGLLSMQARAAEVGGVCTIVNNESSGTAVILSIPYPSSE